MRAIVIVLMTAVLAGCGGRYGGEPTQAELKESWEERNIPPANYRPDILAFMRTYLNNPSGVRGAGISQPFMRPLPGDPGDRYILCIRYDARNTQGQYAGMKTAIVAFSRGRFDRVYDNPVQVPELCKGAAYEPFPELQRLSR